MKMRIGILSRNASLYSTRRLVQAARNRGHDAAVIDTLSVAVEVGLTLPKRHGTKIISSTAAGIARALQVPQVDAIIPRIGTSITFYGLAVVRQFEAQGVLSTANADGIAASRDKLHSLQIMSQAGLPVPRTAIVAHSQALFSAISSVGGLPVVIKLIRGTQGRGVVLAGNTATAAAVLRRVQMARQQALVQEFIAESQGRDLRVIVVGNRCLAAMERSAAEGEFRANLHRGGTARAMELDADTKALAVSAAKAHGLSVAGVDLIHSKRGPLLLEVNSSPGLEGIESVTGVDIAAEIIALLEGKARKQRKRHRRSNR